jgi:hypothetical protein
MATLRGRQPHWRGNVREARVSLWVGNYVVGPELPGPTTQGKQTYAQPWFLTKSVTTGILTNAPWYALMPQ